MPAKDSTLSLSLKPAAFQAGMKALVGYTGQAGRAMGRALQEPIVSGLKSVKGEVAVMFGEIKSGMMTVGTLGGALAVGNFIQDGLKLQRTYGDLAVAVNKVKGNSEDWKTIQAMVEREVGVTGQSAENLIAIFDEMFSETHDLETTQKAMRAIGLAATATGKDVNVLATATQIAMTKFGIRDPEEALARLLDGARVGGLQLEQMAGAFEMLSESADAAGIRGGTAMTTMLNMIANLGDKALPGLEQMFNMLKEGTTQTEALQKAMGSKVKFTADMDSFQRVRTILTSTKGRETAMKVVTGGARIIYDKLAEPFQQAYADAKKSGLSDADALKKGLQAFDEQLETLSDSTAYFNETVKAAQQRMESDPGKKLEMAIEKIRLKFASPEVLGMLDQLAEKLPAFANTIIGIIDKVIENPWGSIATVVGARIALAFAGSVVSEAIAAGAKSFFARALAVQAASGAAAVATQGATTLGVTGAVSAGAGAAGVGTAAAATAGAVAAGAVLAAGAVGGAGGYALYKGVIEGDQEKEFDMVTRAREELMNTSHAKTKEQIEGAIHRLDVAKKNMDQDSDWGGIAAAVMQPFLDVDNPFQKTATDIEIEQRRLRTALKALTQNTEDAAKDMKSAGGTTRGTLKSANPNPGAKPVPG